MNVPTLCKVSPYPVDRPRPTGGRRPRRARKLVFLAVPVLFLVGSGTWFVIPSLHGHRPDLVTHPVHYDKLQLTFSEHGTLAAANNSDIISRVKSRSHGSTVATTLKWVIEDGTPVHKGDVVAQLDDSGVEEDLKLQRLAVLKAQSDWVQAEENCKIVASLNQADIQSAGVALQIADIDLKKYVLGDYEQARKDVEGRILMANADLDQSRERVAWAERMLKKGYLTVTQVQGERDHLESYRLALDRVQEELRVLQNYTKKRAQTELEANAAETRRALARARHQARAKEAQAQSDRLMKLSVYERARQRFRDLEEELANCTMRSPRTGLAVHYVSEQARSGSGSQQGVIAQGEPVRQGQRLMQIPDLSQMIVEANVHETALFHIHGDERQPTGFGGAVQAGLLATPNVFAGLSAGGAFHEMRDNFRDRQQRVVRGGDLVLIQIHAFPDRVWHGHVKQIANLPSQSEWRLTDQKLYQTLIAIDELPEGLKPGMTADVRIFAEQPVNHVLTVPVEAFVGPTKHGEASKCYVLTSEGPQERDVVVGISNDSVVQVKDGIQEGDEVVLNPETLVEKSKALVTP